MTSDTSKHLLIVDDDLELCQLLSDYLTAEGFTISMAHDGQQAIDTATARHFDVIVLDVMLPIKNGFDVLRTLRETIDTPVLMLTAKGEEIDRIVGLEIGADDYLPKPCNPRELVARLKAILRRTQADRPVTQIELQCGELVLHLGRRSVNFGSEMLTFTGAEFSVLELLMRHAGEVLSKDQLTEQALGRKLMPYDRSIDVHISNVRKKLTSAGADKDLIINIRGAGYMLTTTGENL